MKAIRAFLYVQHLLGIGHLRRTARIANALARAGIDVTLASGGFPVQGLGLEDVRFVQLPPAGAADESFKQLVGLDGRIVDEAWKSARRERLLEAFRSADPHLVLIELFPFGRRQLRFELLPLLDTAVSAPHRPLIVCSVRDVLGGGQRDPARQDEMLALFEQYFDRLLVHGDPGLIPFGRTFRHAARLAPRLHYTGYVAETSRAQSNDGTDVAGTGEVVVSAGGGAVGVRLLETALRARGHCALSGATWRILVGVNASRDQMDNLQKLAGMQAGGDLLIERSRPDFTQLLAKCAVSVSQAGYNTLIELISAGARSVVVPYAGGNETEQSVRARAFAERGLTELVEEADLTPEALGAAIDRAAAGPRPAAHTVSMEGARCSAELLVGWMRSRPC